MNVDNDVEQGVTRSEGVTINEHEDSNHVAPQIVVDDDERLPSRHYCRCDQSSTMCPTDGDQHQGFRSTTATACQVALQSFVVTLAVSRGEVIFAFPLTRNKH